MKTIKTTTVINGAGAIYLRDTIRRALRLESGDRLSLEVVNGALIIKPYFNPIDWADRYLYVHNLKYPISYKTGRDCMAGITTVVLSDGRIGVAQCNPNDKFNDLVGEAIALARAFGEDDEIPEEVYG